MTTMHARIMDSQGKSLSSTNNALNCHVASMPLPTNASTLTEQETQTSHLAIIKTNTNDTAINTNGISSDTQTIVSTLSSLNAKVSNAYTTSNLSTTGVVAHANACKMQSLYIMNWASLQAFVRIYDKSESATESDTPVMKFTLYNYQNASITFPSPVDFTNGISVRATTAVADSDTTSPTTNAVSCVITFIP